MKNLFVSFISDNGHENLCIESEVLIKNDHDIQDLEKYIEMTLGHTKVKVINFRRME